MIRAVVCTGAFWLGAIPGIHALLTLLAGFPQ